MAQSNVLSRLYRVVLVVKHRDDRHGYFDDSIKSIKPVAAPTQETKHFRQASS